MSKKAKKEIDIPHGASNWKPSWLNTLTDKKLKNISDLLLFFVIETPIVNESYRGKNFTAYGMMIANF